MCSLIVFKLSPVVTSTIFVEDWFGPTNTYSEIVFVLKVIGSYAQFTKTPVGDENGLFRKLFTYTFFPFIYKNVLSVTPSTSVYVFPLPIEIGVNWTFLNNLYVPLLL